MFGLLLIIGAPSAIVLGRLTISLWAGAASVCQVFEAGDRFGATLFIWPALSLLLWAGYAIPLVALRGRSVIIGFLLGIGIALVIAYWFVSGTGAMIRASVDGAYFCPSGVPEWWPSWLLR
jgi:RsiW-degrading membrane proteinase PrsW (M82 family)